MFILLVLCFGFFFPPCFAADLSILDPASGAYVSGDYEVVLACERPAEVKRTRINLNGIIVFDQKGWHERVTLNFGETIDRHLLVAEVESDQGTLQSPTITTRALRVDYAQSSRLVLISAVVKTGRNRPISGLERERFQVLENGKALPIENFYTESLPLDLVFLLDTSSSLRSGGLDDLKYAATTFIDGLSAGDRVALYEFKQIPRKIMDFTNDRKRLVHMISQLEALGETAFYNALHQGLADLKTRAKGRKAMVVFTDGRDSIFEEPQELAHMMRTAISKAQNQEVALFTMGLGKKIHKDSLERLANETGGRFYHADKSSGLRELFAGVISDLKNQYILGVVPRADRPGFQRLEVKVRKRGARVYARKGYTVE